MHCSRGHRSHSDGFAAQDAVPFTFPTAPPCCSAVTATLASFPFLTHARLLPSQGFAPAPFHAWLPRTCRPLLQCHSPRQVPPGHLHQPLPTPLTLCPNSHFLACCHPEVCHLSCWTVGGHGQHRSVLGRWSLLPVGTCWLTGAVQASFAHGTLHGGLSPPHAHHCSFQ